MGKLKVDLTGKQFGKLTVKEMLPNYKGNHKTYCRCLCECGNEVIKRADYFQSVKGTASCGCYSNLPKEYVSRRKSYVGEKYGHLTVVDMIYNYNNGGQSACKCLCECGKTCIRETYNLTHYNGNPPHCGCLTEYYKEKQSEKSRKDITGKRFNRLVVTKMIFEYKNQTKVECLCDCGNTIIVPATYLTSGETTSCGCFQKERAKESNTKDFTNTVSDYGVIFISPKRKLERGTWLWNCKCGLCGENFVALPAKVLNGAITSCGCAKRSSGERLIDSILSDNQVKYYSEYSFDDCKNINKLRFDFFLPEYNTLIEYQGEQHYRSVPLFGGDEGYKRRQENDRIKRDYCKSNNIKLIEIPYTYSDNKIKETITNIIYP